MKVMDEAPTGCSRRLIVTEHGFPTRREPHGNGGPIVVVGVTTYRGGREGRPQGEGAEVVEIQSPKGTRDAESLNGSEYHLLPKGDRIDRWRAR